MTDDKMHNKRRKQILYAFTLSLLSICIGLIYLHLVPTVFWFSFDFLGPEKGSESSTVNVWGIISIIIGSILFLISIVTMLKRSDYLNKVFINVLFVGTVLVIILQIPSLFLWITMGTMSQIFEGLKAVMLHTFILIVASKLKHLTISVKEQT